MMSKPLAWINAITGDITTVDCSDTLLWAPLYLAPKNQEPLSELEIYRLYENAEYLGFLAYKKGIKDAEKAHGITGVDDESC